MTARAVFGTATMAAGRRSAGRIATRLPMTARKLRPLTKNATPMSNTPIASPATAGPTIRAALKIAELSATALPMSSRPTISITKACRVGMSTALEQPSVNAISTICQTWIWWVRVRKASRKARTIAIVWVAMRVRRFGQAVGNDAAEQAEDQDRGELSGGDDAEHQRATGQGEDKPVLGDVLHPGPDERDELAGPEQSVVAMTQGAQAVEPGDRSDGAHGADRRPAPPGERLGRAAPGWASARRGWV